MIYIVYTVYSVYTVYTVYAVYNVYTVYTAYAVYTVYTMSTGGRLARQETAWRPPGLPAPGFLHWIDLQTTLKRGGKIYHCNITVLLTAIFKLHPRV